MSNSHPAALLSIDVEDWFQVDNLKEGIPRESWGGRELRVEGNISLILDVLEQHSTKATFFILGWIAERLPELVKQIHAHGHEIASHGYRHELVYSMDPAKFRNDVGASKELLENLIGEQVLGYRAPNFSITDWAIDVLAELGFTYDSSLFPTMVHDRYGKLSGVQSEGARCIELKQGFYEIQLSCLPVFGQNVPWSGGAYFRLLPYGVFRRGVRKILQTQKIYCFYVHPWEFDPGQPRVSNISLAYKFRHYNNLSKTYERFVRLVDEFQFGPIRKAVPSGSSETCEM